VDADLVVFVIALVLVLAAQAAVLATSRPKGALEIAWVLVPAIGLLVLVVLAWRVVTG
jgi:heme/copper-type cytochrome/quinol oxidase subunit 2